jgi:hypothetical protein
MIPLGDIHLRAHRITLDPHAHHVTAEEGSAPLGYEAGAVPTLRHENGWAFVEFGSNAIGIRPIAGYTTPPKIAAGSPNSVYGFNLLPTLTVSPLRPHHTLICAIYEGAPADTARIPRIDRVNWEPDGRFVAHVGDKTITVPPLRE